jgi:hypothetical protein
MDIEKLREECALSRPHHVDGTTRYFMVSIQRVTKYGDSDLKKSEWEKVLTGCLKPAFLKAGITLRGIRAFYYDEGRADFCAPNLMVFVISAVTSEIEVYFGSNSYFLGICNANLLQFIYDYKLGFNDN